MIPNQPQSGRPFVCFRFVPGCRFIVQLDGSTMVNVIVQLHPDPVAVIVEVAARSPAVNVTVVPLVEDNVPPPLTDQVAGAGETVSSTSSPTPIRVLARFVGEVATV